MSNRTSRLAQVFIRAHTVATLRKKSKPQRSFRERNPKWPKYVIVIDSETTRDTVQSLTFGSCRFCRWDPDTKKYVCIDEIFFYADEVPASNPEGLACLREYVASEKAEVPDGYPGLQLL